MFNFILDNYLKYSDSTIDGSHPFFSEMTVEYKLQQSELHDITMKTNLLFSEFDNGKLFEKEMESHIKLISISDNKPYINAIIKTLSDFKTHISEFRS